MLHTCKMRVLAQNFFKRDFFPKLGSHARLVSSKPRLKNFCARTPHPFSSPEPTILLVCAKDRDLWQGPEQEVRESRTSGFCAQPQKFETITVTIGYKNGQLLRLRVTWTLPEVSILGADQKDRGLWGRECTSSYMCVSVK